MENILITGTGSLNGQAIIKSLKKSRFHNEWRLIGCDYFQNTVGSFWCDKNYVLPDILQSGMLLKWKKRIFDIVEENRIKIIYIGVDFELLLFEEFKCEIEEKYKCTVVVSSKETLEIGNDKYKTFLFLKDNKLNYASTFLIEDKGREALKYPYILKPRVGARSKGVYIISSEEELNGRCREVSDGIVQELIGTSEQEYTCGVVCLEGELVSSIVLRRTLKEGNTFIAEYRENYPIQIYEYLSDISRKLDIFGSCNFQLRLNEKQEPILFEINPRFSGTTYIRSLFGYNEVEYITRWILNGERIEFDLHEGRVMRYYDEMLIGENV